MGGLRIRLDLSDFVYNVNSKRIMYLDTELVRTVADLENKIRDEHEECGDMELLIFVEGGYLVPTWEPIQVLQPEDLVKVVLRSQPASGSKHKTVVNNGSSSAKRKRDLSSDQETPRLQNSNKKAKILPRVFANHKLRQNKSKNANEDSDSSDDSEDDSPSVAKSKLKTSNRKSHLSKNTASKQIQEKQMKAIKKAGKESSSESSSESESEEESSNVNLKTPGSKETKARNQNSKPAKSSSSSSSSSSDDSSSDSSGKEGKVSKSVAVSQSAARTKSSSSSSSSSSESESGHHQVVEKVSRQQISGGQNKKPVSPSSSDSSSDSSDEDERSKVPKSDLNPTKGRQDVADHNKSGVTNAQMNTANNSEVKRKRKRKRKNKNKNKLPPGEMKPFGDMMEQTQLDSQNRTNENSGRNGKTEAKKQNSRFVFEDSSESCTSDGDQESTDQKTQEEPQTEFSADEIRKLYELSKPVSALGHAVTGQNGSGHQTGVHCETVPANKDNCFEEAGKTVRETKSQAAKNKFSFKPRALTIQELRKNSPKAKMTRVSVDLRQDSNGEATITKQTDTNESHGAENPGTAGINAQDDFDKHVEESDLMNTVDATKDQYSNKSEVIYNPADYDSLKAVNAADLETDNVVAFKMIEMSECYTPELSDFKQARVVDKVDTQITLQILNPVKKKKAGRFELNPDEDSQEETLIQINIADMMDTRIIKS